MSFHLPAFCNLYLQCFHQVSKLRAGWRGVLQSLRHSWGLDCHPFLLRSIGPRPDHCIILSLCIAHWLAHAKVIFTHCTQQCCSAMQPLHHPVMLSTCLPACLLVCTHLIACVRENGKCLICVRAHPFACVSVWLHVPLLERARARVCVCLCVCVCLRLASSPSSCRPSWTTSPPPSSWSHCCASSCPTPHAGGEDREGGG